MKAYTSKVVAAWLDISERRVRQLRGRKSDNGNQTGAVRFENRKPPIHKLPAEEQPGQRKHNKLQCGAGKTGESKEGSARTGIEAAQK